MTFKKGDKVRTDDGHMGEILFIDNDGIEAQVALENSTVKLRIETLRVFDEKDNEAAELNLAATKPKRASRAAKK